MAVLTGWLALAPVGGQVTPAITVDLQQYEPDYWPEHGVLVGATPSAVLVTHWPVSVTPSALSGWRAHAFGDDWYHRVHIRPAVLALGNVLETQITPIKVWNAHLVPQLLLSIAGLDTGIEVTGPVGPPTPFAALQEQDWQVRATRDGPGRIDVTLTWAFEATAAPRLRITGNRVVAWGWVPDWSDGVLERLAWLTSIESSPSGAEQRRALRLAPRRTFEIRALVHGRDRQLLDLALAGWGGRVWALPVWPDVQQLGAAVALGSVAVPCSTEQRDFNEGGLAMMIGADAFDVEAVEVLTVGAGSLTLKRPTQRAWAAGARLYPARNAVLEEQPQLTRRTDQLQAVEATFRLVDSSDWPAATLPAYRGAPVFSLRPDESEDLTQSWQRLQLLLDNQTGTPAITDTADLGFAVQGHRWVLGGRQEQTDWRGLAYALRGRQVAVWLPTHADDLELVAVATETAGAIDVRAVGYTRYAVGKPGRRDVRIELSDGSALHRRITGATELSSDIERLAIDTAPGVVLRPAGSTGVQVQRISWLQLVRLDQDQVELQHLTDADGVATVQAVFRSLRDELELA